MDGVGYGHHLFHPYRKYLFATRRANSSLGTEIEGPIIDVGGVDLGARLPRPMLVWGRVEAFVSQPAKAFGFLSDALQLQAAPDWLRQRTAVLELLRWFFSNFAQPEWWGFLSTTPCRPKADSVAKVKLIDRAEDVQWKGKRLTGIKWDFGFDSPVLSLAGFRLADHADGRQKNAEVVRFVRRRSAKRPTGVAPVSTLYIVCKAERGADQQHLSEGLVPVIATSHYDPDRHLWTCHNLLLAAISAYRPYWVFHLHVPLRPGDGQVINVATACLPFTAFRQQYPMYDPMLRDAGVVCE